MGKLLKLGKKIKYPITITKLYKGPGDAIEKEDALFQYTFTWFQEVGDPFGEMWKEKQTTPADWESPADGKILKWKIQVGMVIEKDTECIDVEESCSHAVQYAGLCVVCGKDMRTTSWAAEGTDADRAQINMIHDQTLLSVSQDEADRMEEQKKERLLKNRKLSLVVDLDQTIIHACIEPTVGEWQSDPTSPNYEAVKDVRKFQLADDGPRGLAFGYWYYIKMRPGLKDFLAHVAELYELHVYTMGTRAYAQNIAKIVDPDRKLFGDRIISRDENGSMTAKTLSRLFPKDTRMVVIIDDRADVWPKNRLNLIKVVPYDFFVGIGDINSSFLPKRQDVPKVATSTKPKSSDKPNLLLESPDTEEKKESPDVHVTTDSEIKEADAANPETKVVQVSALEELVTMGGGDRRTQAEEQEKFLEQQIKDRPLLHMQQQLEKEDGDPTDVGNEKTEENSDGIEHTHERHHLLKDDDEELAYLESHLTGIRSRTRQCPGRQGSLSAAWLQQKDISPRRNRRPKDCS